jgi:di/tricarboxylate transporter
MALRSVRSILSHGIPEYPEEQPTWQSFVQDVLAEPMIAPFRLFWHNFLEARPWWPVLIPLMVWVGWRSYKRERRRYFAEQRKLAAKRAVTLIH